MAILRRGTMRSRKPRKGLEMRAKNMHITAALVMGESSPPVTHHCLGSLSSCKVV